MSRQVVLEARSSSPYGEGFCLMKAIVYLSGPIALLSAVAFGRAKFPRTSPLGSTLLKFRVTPLP